VIWSTHIARDVAARAVEGFVQYAGESPAKKAGFPGPDKADPKESLPLNLFRESIAPGTLTY
jgi:hypothetical protein